MLNTFRNNVPRDHIHQFCDGTIPEIYGMDNGRVTGLPGNLFIPSLDPYTLYRELSVLKKPDEVDSQRAEKNSKIRWLTSELCELGLNFMRTSENKNWLFKSRAISVPFICSKDKPAILYVAGLNGTASVGQSKVNRINSVLMGLALAIQLQKTEEYLNAAILFIDNETIEDAALLICETIQRRMFQTSIHAIVELGFFSGKDVVVTGNEESATSKNFEIPISMAGLNMLPGIPEDEELWHNQLKEQNYDVVTVQSVPEKRSESIVKADLSDPGLAYSSSYGFKALYRVLFQHAIVASSRTYYNFAEDNHAHRH